MQKTRETHAAFETIKKWLTCALIWPLAIYKIQDNVFGKARVRKAYCSTATADNAAQKHSFGSN
jgi:hypothetical protein